MNWLLPGLVGLVIGVLLMFFIMHRRHDDKNSVAMKKQLNDYQDRVENHFAKTADLIDHLTDSYKRVFDHLSESAEQLLDDEQIQRQIINRKKRQVTLNYLSDSNSKSEEMEDQ